MLSNNQELLNAPPPEQRPAPVLAVRRESVPETVAEGVREPVREPVRTIVEKAVVPVEEKKEKEEKEEEVKQDDGLRQFFLCSFCDSGKWRIAVLR